MQSRFFKVSYTGGFEFGIMAWLESGKTFQYVAETGEFHDNPALFDDYIHERYNTYIQISPESLPELLRQVKRYPASLQWIVDIFSSQKSCDRLDAAELGVCFTEKLACSNQRILSEVTTHASLTRIQWLYDALTLGINDNVPFSIKDIAVERITAAIAYEPQITADIIYASEDCETFGLEHRIKTPDSLAKKLLSRGLARTVAHSDLRMEDIAAETEDIIRFTLLSKIHDKLLCDAQRAVFRLLERSHSIVESMHMYVDGNFYKGFKAIMKSPSGQLYELQFRSALNLEYKDKAYPFYKLSRDLSKPLAERKAAFEKTQQIYAALPRPLGLDEKAMLGDVPIVARKFQIPLEYGG